MEFMAIATAVALTITMLFQLALAAGAPWGRAAWGGRHPGRLPGRLRLSSALAGIIVYPAITLFVLDAGGVLDLGLAGRSSVTRTILWAFTGLFGLGAVANFASRSKVERFWGPVAVVIAVGCGVLAAGT